MTVSGSNSLGFHLVAVRIMISGEGEVANCFPHNNRIGALLLCKLLTQTLQSAGLLYGGNDKLAAMTGDLNDCYFQVAVTDPAASIRLVQPMLEEACILPCAIVAWFDYAELIWRPSHPAKLNVTFESLIPKQAGWQALRRRILALMK